MIRLWSIKGARTCLFCLPPWCMQGVKIKMTTPKQLKICEKGLENVLSSFGSNYYLKLEFSLSQVPKDGSPLITHHTYLFAAAMGWALIKARRNGPRIIYFFPIYRYIPPKSLLFCTCGAGAKDIGRDQTTTDTYSWHSNLLENTPFLYLFSTPYVRFLTSL